MVVVWTLNFSLPTLVSYNNHPIIINILWQSRVSAKYKISNAKYLGTEFAKYKISNRKCLGTEFAKYEISNTKYLGTEFDFITSCSAVTVSYLHLSTSPLLHPPIYPSIPKYIPYISHIRCILEEGVMQNKFSSVFCRPGGLGADTFWQGRVGLSKTKLWGILLAPFPFKHAHVLVYPVMCNIFLI